MTMDQKIAELEPWDERLALSMAAESDQWLDTAASVCIRASRNRSEAVRQLAEAMEEYLMHAIDELVRSTPMHIMQAMDGFCHLEPNLSFDRIADALMEDYWPLGTPKPVLRDVSNNRRPAARRPGMSTSKNRKVPSKKKPVRTTAGRHRP